MFKKELRTKQTTLEQMRFQYLQSTAGDDEAIPSTVLGGLKEPISIQYSMNRSVQNFYPINPPAFENQQHTNKSMIIAPASREVRYNLGPRFNYNEYMKNLDHRLGAQAITLTGNEFQNYLLREKENFTKNIHQYNAVESPLVTSLSNFKHSHQHGVDHQEASFNLGSLQESHYPRGLKASLGNSFQGKSSGNSLHYISKNLGSSVGEDKL